MAGRDSDKRPGEWPLLFQGARFAVRKSPPGPGGIQREIVVHPGSAVIVPEVAPGRLLLIENQRVAAGRTLLEFPAGTMEPPEPPEACAARELREETGYQAARFSLLGRLYPAPGVSTELMHIFLARELTFVGQQLDPGEEITTLEMEAAELLRLARKGALEDAKTLCGLALYHWTAQVE